jgi:hypothetical protein
MRSSYTSVVERRKKIDDVFHSHPYEAAWALEGMFFLTVEHAPHPELEVSVEVSADGLHWTRWGDVVAVAPEQDLVAISAEHFGHWLRLRILGADHERPAVITVQLALKG